METLLSTYSELLSKAGAVPYMNHARRVFNMARNFDRFTEEDVKVLAVAAVAHDLGIWTQGTFDYLPPSADLG